MERIAQLNQIPTRYTWRDWAWNHREDIAAIGGGLLTMTAFWLAYCFMA